MDPAEYEAFTEELVGRLAGDPRVLGVVALGSMAGRDYAADEWSDHDFFVIAEAGEQEPLRTDLSWLPRTGEIALSFRETDHGLKVVYQDGHLLEFAVFDLEETGLAGVNRYRVLLDRGGVADRLAEVAAATAARPSPDDDFQFAMFVSAILVGAGRARRGEVLSGGMFVRTLALQRLLVLLARAVPSEQAALLDDLDPFRRFEVAYPALAAELAEIVRGAPDEAGLQLLALAERELRQLRPGFAWEAAAVIRARLGDVPPR